jgi:hypothetical protein
MSSLWRTLPACRVDNRVDVRELAQCSGHRHDCRCGKLEACATRGCSSVRVGVELSCE